MKAGVNKVIYVQYFYLPSLAYPATNRTKNFARDMNPCFVKTSGTCFAHEQYLVGKYKSSRDMVSAIVSFLFLRDPKHAKVYKKGVPLAPSLTIESDANILEMLS